ncbi:MAG: 2-hydroxyacyl-CoA dehydratase family protein [Thermodesulfobacteriota bacterium]|nr:2-hydroxyacyl-CoA dehydratase family protein [Thermodesulfobacteriota bacterium]
MVEKELQNNPYRKIDSTSAYRRLMTAYYFMVKHPAWFGKKVAWITSGGPVEPLYAMGVLPFYPENYGAMCGASRMSPSLCEAAEQKGYSHDLCSYALTDIGSFFTGKGPIGRLPKPDFLVCGNNICGTVIKWYEIQARALRVPLFFLDTPFFHDELHQHNLRYVEKQMGEYIAFLEDQMKRPFLEKRFKKVASRSFEAISLWREILDLSRNQPAPFAAFDAFIHMAPIVTLRGTRWAVRYYQKLKRELEERVKKGLGAFAREEIRLVWDNIPIWYDIRNLSKLLSSNGAVLVADTYTSAWAMEEPDLTYSLDGLARAYATIHLNRGLGYKMQKIATLIEKFGAHGFIMHSNRSCKPYSLGQYDMRREVTRLTGKPGLIIEADHTDSRSYSPQQVEKQILIFLDIIRNKQQGST